MLVAFDVCTKKVVFGTEHDGRRFCHAQCVDRWLRMSAMKWQSSTKICIKEK